MTLAQVKKLVRQTEKAAKLVSRNRLLIETYLSMREAKEGKVTSHKSTKALFKRLHI
ncbi:hypothetical protein HYV30_02415 [Candidatus Kaiserbacteria bacterium]|nr:hypothetical protein [Candidatus Kaiserbacteria bacterium]